VDPILAGGDQFSRYDKAFENAKTHIYKLGRYTEKDELLLCLPDIAEAMMTNAENVYDAKGWEYLIAMFKKWFSENGSTDIDFNNPFIVDFSWVMGYTRASERYNDFTNPDRIIDAEYDSAGMLQYGYRPHIINNAARASLGNLLCRKDKLIESNGVFDFTNVNNSEIWDYYYTQIVVGPDILADEKTVHPDGLNAALNNFVFRALAKGYFIFDGGNYYTIHITGVVILVYDKFDFTSDRHLGVWDCDEKTYGSTLEDTTPNHVSDSDFRGFRERNFYGRDFLVLSERHEVENFTEVSFEYKCQKKGS
jgi:hypothetical protein